MALDFLLLQRYPHSSDVRLRHYGWHRPAFTFGYSQKIAFVRDQLPAGECFELLRRPTGGGIVDHRDDWTYALVIPRGHALEALRAVESYRAVHEALAVALERSGQPAELKTDCEPRADGEACGPAGVCFSRAERFDVVDPVGRKIAGAAQKRNKHGLLFQGSIWRPSAPGVAEWDTFHDVFADELARALRVDAEDTGWPEFNEDEVSGLTETYGMPEWNEHR